MGCVCRAAFKGQEETVKGAPEDECPVGPMPQPAQQHDERQVHIGAPRTLPVSTQRNVKIIAQKGAEGDVPAPPEIRDALRAIGGIEVLDKLEPDHPAQSHRHIRVAGEIEVNLKGIRQHAKPGVHRRQRSRAANAVSAMPPIGLASRIFLAETQHEQARPRRRIVRGYEMRLDQLSGHRVDNE